MTHRVIIPCVPSEACSPNTRQHWARRAKAVRELRRAAWAAGCNARPRSPYTGRVLLEARIGWPKGRRVLDRSNAAASLKGALDGLQDAGWFGGDDREVDVIVVEQLTWGRLDAGTRALYPGGFVAVEVVKDST